MIKSLRWRLQIWHAVILAVVLTLFGGYSYALQWDSRLQQVDAELDRTAGIVMSRLRWGYRRVRDDDERDRRRPPPLNRPAALQPVQPTTVRASLNLSPHGQVAATLANRSADEPNASKPGNDNRTSRESSDRSRESSRNRNDNDRDGRRRGSGRGDRFGRDMRWEWKGISYPDDMLNPPDDETNAPIYFSIWNASGELLQRSQAAPSMPYPGPDASERESESREPVLTRTTRIIDGRREVVHAVGWGGFIHTIVVGRSLTDETAAQHRFLMLIIGAGSAFLGVGMLGGWWLTTRAIRPITAMSRTASSISATNLAARIDVRDTDTELGQLASVLNQTFDRLQTAFEQQVRFTADASHELRTPVSILLAQTQMALSKPRADEEYREALDSCRRAALRMKLLTESLLSLARFDSNGADAERGSVELKSLIDDTVELLQPVAAEHEVTVKARGGPLSVEGDGNQISQMLMNLISNAIRYNRPRGRVDVELQRQDDSAVIDIRDSGMGISADDLPHVFERFYRIDKARSRAIGGSGLGLSIAHAIVLAHGGEITVDSEVDVGTTVTVKLPVGALS